MNLLLSVECCWCSICQESSRQAFSPLCRPSSKEDVIPTVNLPHIFYVLQLYPENYHLCQCFEYSPTLFLVVSKNQIFDTLWVYLFIFSSCSPRSGTEGPVYTRQALYHRTTLLVPLTDFHMEQEIVVMFQSFPVVFLELCWIPLVLPLGILPLPLPPYVYLSICLWNIMMPDSVVYPGLFFFYGFKSFL